MLAELQGRGVQDIVVVAVESDIQTCIVHQIRNSLQFVSRNDYAAVTTELKPIDTANASRWVDRTSKRRGSPIVAKAW